MKKILFAAVSAAALLTACGGGGNSGETKAKVTSVKVVGASLADSGTFGYKFTVQSTSGTPHRVYTERIAASYGVNTLCSAYTANLAGRNAGCTNYAVAGAAINYYNEDDAEFQPDSPQSQIQQLIDAGNAGFGSNDLLIVGEGSANDTSVFAGAYGTPLFSTLLGSLLSGSEIAANAGSPVNLGALYMQKLADKLVTELKINAIDKGASRIVVLNTLDVTKTPRFALAMAALNANSGGGSAGAAAVASYTGLVQAWIQAYNARLQSNLAPYASKVAIVDFYTNFNDEMANPTQYGLTNVTATVCDQIYAVANSYTPSVLTAGTTALSTPAVVGSCTNAAASAITPTEGATGASTWWQTYLYADYFHPTPYGHQLLAQLVAKRLTEAGWL